MSRKPSIFAQKMEKMREIRRNANLSLTDSVSKVSSSSCTNLEFGDRSYILTGQEACDIHLENVNKLSAMSKQEIEKNQNELLQILRPSQIEFLRRKRSENINTDLEMSFDNLTTKEMIPSINLELKSKGVHMDVVEPEKLKWMEELPDITKPLPDTLYNARFNFDGELLPYIEEGKSTCDKGLYHHGEEPQRPGYTIEELYLLSRSSVTRQRIIALNTLAAILEKEHILSLCLETPLLKQLLNSGIFLILRFSLDENLRTVHLAALRAIAALLWRPLDMHYLSDTIGLFGDLKLPSFEVNLTEINESKMEELKDIELIQLDVIKGALRTDILQRLRYLLEDPLLETDHLLLIIKCLTRICYHSYEATCLVVNTPTLLEILFLHTQFPLNSEKLYIAKLMMLFRVIACRSIDFANVLVNRLNILPFLLKIIGDTVTKTSTASQCIYLWHVLLHYGIGTDSIREFSPVFLTLLNQLHVIQIGNLKLEFITFGTALITLIIFLVDQHYNYVEFLVPKLEQLCCLWINVIENERDVPREFVKLLVNSVYLLTIVSTQSNANLIYFHTKMKSSVRLAAYTNLASNMKHCSFILNADKRSYVDNLPSLCIPMSILNSFNSINLTHSAIKYALLHSDYEFAVNIFNNHVWHYVNYILEFSHLPEIANLWCSRYEIYFLYDIVKLCTKLNIYVDKKLIQLAFTLVRIIHVDDAPFICDLFSTVLFNAKVYESVMIEKNPMTNILDDLESIKKFFLSELNLSRDNVPSLTSTKNGTDFALSTDWHYIPILKISNAKQASNIPVQSIRHILKWVYLIEYLSDYIRTEMSVACRYCRISCIFFCGDIFLDLTDLLGVILYEIMKKNNLLEFKTDVPGISSFYDFYRELCEQFASSSYCNTVFAMYILVPLQQKHDCKLKKYVWMEQAVILRFINLSNDQLMVPIENFMNPCETDIHLLETYLRVIATGRIKENICPVMYKIGLHHVATFIEMYKNENAAVKLRCAIEKIGNEVNKISLLKCN